MTPLKPLKQVATWHPMTSHGALRVCWFSTFFAWKKHDSKAFNRLGALTWNFTSTGTSVFGIAPYQKQLPWPSLQLGTMMPFLILKLLKGGHAKGGSCRLQLPWPCSARSSSSSPLTTWVNSSPRASTPHGWTCRSPRLIFVRPWSVHTDRVNSVAWSEDGRWLISGSDDKSVRLWEPATGDLWQTLDGYQKVVKSVDIKRPSMSTALRSYYFWQQRVDQSLDFRNSQGIFSWLIKTSLTSL